MCPSRVRPSSRETKRFRYACVALVAVGLLISACGRWGYDNNGLLCEQSDDCKRSDGGQCLVPEDCLSGVCTANVCIAPTCSDGVRNQNETGIDSGGICGARSPLPPGTYRSIGTFIGDLCGGARASILNGQTVATFDLALPTNVGAGDQLTIGSETFYIHSRDSSTQVTVQTAASATHALESCTIRRAYNSLQGWENDRQGDLVASDRIEVGVAYADSPFSEVLSISGSITDANHYMHLTTAVDSRHNGVIGGGVVLEPPVPVVGSRTIEVLDNHTKIDWLEVRNIDYDSGGGAVLVVESATDVTMGHLIIHDALGVNTTAIQVRQGSADTLVFNCVLFNMTNFGIKLEDKDSSLSVYNTTVYNTGGSAGINKRMTADWIIVQNTISMNNAEGADFDFDGTGTYSNNLSSDSTATDFDPVHSISGYTAASQFISVVPGSEDLHLQVGSVAINAAIDLSGIFTTDFDDQLRSGLTWDIGADER